MWCDWSPPAVTVELVLDGCEQSASWSCCWYRSVWRDGFEADESRTRSGLIADRVTVEAPASQTVVSSKWTGGYTCVFCPRSLGEEDLGV